MPRKPAETVQVNLRIKEALRRRLESAAKRRQVSLNYEMTSRLQDTLDRGDLYEMAAVAEDMKINWQHWAQAFQERYLLNDLVKATEALIAQVEPGVSDEKAEKAIGRVLEVINAINTDIGLAGRRVTTPGG